MASRQEKQERAEVEAWQAAQDLREANAEREYEEEARRNRAGETERDRAEETEQRPGVIVSALKAVGETLEHAKEAVVGKSKETAEETVEYKDCATEKVKESGESAAEKAEEEKDYTTKKAKETTDETTEVKLSESEEEEALRRIEELRLGDTEGEVIGVEKIVLEVPLQAARPEEVASKLKEADQMTGQTFNDVGRIDDEGVATVECKRVE